MAKLLQAFRKESVHECSEFKTDCNGRNDRHKLHTVADKEVGDKYHEIMYVNSAEDLKVQL